MQAAYLLIEEKRQAKSMAKEPLEKELEQMFREDLIVACQYWGVDFDKSQSGDSLVKLLAEQMKIKENREKMFNTLTEREKDLLGMLTLNQGAMSYEKLKPFRRQYSYGQLNQTERDLRKKGFIVRRIMTRVTNHGREVAEFKIIDFFLPHFVDYFSRKPEHHPEKPPKSRTIVNERDSFIVDMLILLSYIAKNEIIMTSSWEFPKRAMERIKETMSKPTDDRFDRVQKIARKAGAYRIIDNDRVVPGNVRFLFEGKQNDVARKLLLTSLGRTRAIWATPEQPTEYTLNLAICRLRESTLEDWISISEMKDWIRSELFISNQPLKWIQVDEERVRMALETPVLLGLLEGAYKGKKLQGVRLTPVGKAVISNTAMDEYPNQDTFLVQPNFEVTVFTSEMNYYKLYQLMLFTEPVKIDVVSTFRITDKSIFQAIELGYRDTNILEFLEGESKKPVPANVTTSIKDWTSQTTFVSISEVILFETETERDLEDLMMLEDFNQFVVRRVGPTAVVIKGDVDEIGEELRKHKCHIKQSEDEYIVNIDEPQSAIAEQLAMFEDGIDNIPTDCVGCPAIFSCNKMIKRRVRASRGIQR